RRREPFARQLETASRTRGRAPRRSPPTVATACANGPACRLDPYSALDPFPVFAPTAAAPSWSSPARVRELSLSQASRYRDKEDSQSAETDPPAGATAPASRFSQVFRGTPPAARPRAYEARPGARPFSHPAAP